MHHLSRSRPSRPYILAVYIMLFSNASVDASAQSAPITSSGLNTQISAPQSLSTGQSQYNITGGTRPGGGTNLFHSFGQFNVPSNNIANFLNETALPTSNILGRVTGGNISNILGIIQTTGFGNANLFLMNPAGFLFGPNATVNVGGMVAFTSADYLRLADGARFNSIPNASTDALLSAAPVAAFGFLGSNPGAITVEGSQLTVTEGTGISLVGGDITIKSGMLDNGTVQAAKLSAPGGHINLASVASLGEVQATTLNQTPNINGQSFGALGTIQVSEQSVIDVSGNGGGTVLIRGGNFVLDNSTISANITGSGPVINGVEAIGSGIDIQVTEKALIQPGSLLETNVLGNATPGVTYGGTHIKADRIEIIGDPGFDFSNGPFTEIHSDVAPGSTGGNAGAITLEGNSILLQDFVTLHSYSEGAGNAANVILRASGNLEINGSMIDTEADSPSPGNAGNIELTSTHGNILMTNAAFLTSQAVFTTGNAGDIIVSAPNGDVLLAGVPNDASLVSAIFTGIRGTGGTGGSGGIQITANNLTLDNGIIGGDNLSPLRAGDIAVNLAGTLRLDGQSVIETVARRGGAPSADLTITAHDISLTNNSSLITHTFSTGAGGLLNLFTETLQLTNGSTLTSGSQIQRGFGPPSGPGGAIRVQGLAGPAQSVLIDGTGSGIFTTSEGTGAGGSIYIQTQSLVVQNGGTLSAATSGTAPSATGGTITVDASNTVTMTGGATMTANSSGAADAGSINITALNGLNMQNSAITTQVTPSAGSSAGGGNIKITTSPEATVLLQNSTISASVADGPGGGGNISIDPQFVILQNSQILAQAAQGQGGAITIVAGLFLPDATSVVNADSGSGLNGNITIQSPNSPASGKILPLSQMPLLPTALFSQHCAALAGGNFSSFTLAGRESLPAEPGSWLSAPLAFGGDTEKPAPAAAHMHVPASLLQDGSVSLRQMGPTLFMAQSQSDDWAGCVMRPGSNG